MTTDTNLLRDLACDTSEALELIDSAINEISGQSLVDSNTMVNLLLDIRLSIAAAPVADVIAPL